MKEQHYQFSYKIFENIQELDSNDAQLLEEARKLTAIAYAPYSQFNVACAARLANGEIVKGTNQENASFPVGICAERSLLATVGTLFPNEVIDTLAISYNALNGESNKPISPCGMCRQALTQYEMRVNHPIKIILSGMEGNIFMINTAKDLLPLTFGEADLQ